MTTRNIRLYKAIRCIVDKEGKDIIKEARFVNILDDIMSFDDMPATKPILRDMVNGGYTSRLLEWQSHEVNYDLNELSILSSVVKEKGYQKEIVRYILGCIAYGLHKTEAIPTYGISDDKEGEPKEKIVSFDLNRELAELKSDYSSLLNSTITIPEKASGYYTASALTEIYFLSNKIRIVSDILHTDDYKWCLNEKTKILSQYHIEPERPKKLGLLSRLFRRKA